jgi:hypothetical protein
MIPFIVTLLFMRAFVASVVAAIVVVALQNLPYGVFSTTTLNAYAALGREVHSRVRRRLYDLLKVDTQLRKVVRNNQQCRGTKDTSRICTYLWTLDIIPIPYRDSSFQQRKSKSVQAQA